MNRLKLWLFALIVLAAAALGLRWLARDLRKQAIDGIDRQLLAAQARAESAEQYLTADLAAVAALAAQDDQLATALQAGAPAEPAPGAKPRKSVQNPPATRIPSRSTPRWIRPPPRRSAPRRRCWAPRSPAARFGP